ncbi:hypothetical protein APR41_10325 [Salegentibacter salinarum]|uniref:Uncharacterized protein n=1 Tax=Salegentibacter salinarum TaxID=447422 RepID=A0A2N0TN78_9FLAO|nr:hypothetical protein APR41_10325 [Salegentibacter salinarum]
MPFKNYFFVGMQFVLFIAWIFDIEALKLNRLEFLQPVFLVLSGIGFLIVLISILQLNTNLSPFPKPKENAILITNGLFKYIKTSYLLRYYNFSLFSFPVFCFRV